MSDPTPVALMTARDYALRQAENAKRQATKGGPPVQSYYAAKVAAYEDMAATLDMAIQVLDSATAEQVTA